MILYQRRCGKDGVIPQPLKTCIVPFTYIMLLKESATKTSKITSDFRKFLLTTEMQE